MNWDRFAEYWAGEVENSFQGTILTSDEHNYGILETHH